jgi:trk system potassium uptake protein TrkH
VLFVYVWSTLRGERGCNAFGRRVSDENIKKASNVLIINLVLSMIAAIAISAMQSFPMEDIMFEIYSAIGTVGMTTGITRDLNSVSRVIIILLMYCGRVGGMSFAMSFTERKKVPPVQLPVEKVMIG